MFFHGPSLQPLLKFGNLQEFIKDFQGMDNLAGGVAVYGSAAAYALVWELGSLRAKKPGPRTLWSINRNGRRIIMSTQAPGGYVAINEDKFWPIIEAELDKVDYGQNAKRIQLEMSVAIDNASQKIARIVAETAPVASGDLRSQISGVDTDETSILGNDSKLVSAGTLIL